MVPKSESRRVAVKTDAAQTRVQSSRGTAIARTDTDQFPQTYLSDERFGDDYQASLEPLTGSGMPGESSPGPTVFIGPRVQRVIAPRRKLLKLFWCLLRP